jgi:hypothetical protein
MLAFRSVVSVLVSFVRSFSTNSRPACGRPTAALRPGDDTTATGEPASPSPQVVPRQAPGAAGAEAAAMTTRG